MPVGDMFRNIPADFLKINFRVTGCGNEVTVLPAESGTEPA